MDVPATACAPATRADLVSLCGTGSAVHDEAKQHRLHHIPADVLTGARFVAEGGEGEAAPLARQSA